MDGKGQAVPFTKKAWGRLGPGRVTHRETASVGAAQNISLQRGCPEALHGSVHSTHWTGQKQQLRVGPHRPRTPMPWACCAQGSEARAP